MTPRMISKLPLSVTFRRVTRFFSLCSKSSSIVTASSGADCWSRTPFVTTLSWFSCTPSLRGKLSYTQQAAISWTSWTARWIQKILSFKILDNDETLTFIWSRTNVGKSLIRLRILCNRNLPHSWGSLSAFLNSMISLEISWLKLSY